jgi:hypothetical protein
MSSNDKGLQIGLGPKPDQWCMRVAGRYPDILPGTRYQCNTPKQVILQHAVESRKINSQSAVTDSAVL